ncbi:PilX N-terminal domain-containing pilus assembly protein [Evansella tamaricis]|uniref:Type 4 fimbrial biogenesis protein PilX N-terminal domain-containing protein n=1 Tax=Evansella tamaricis TaxID=2069301 RepID=A0ABS6JCT7_9BACI|nr:PilX N-terminal domain-containing pilus assembly protein [Evansella tamaricis]MBU9711009.1 hypothetical protein [Evansella tamaricis]
MKCLLNVKNQLNNERGITFIIVLIVIVVLTVLGVSLMAATATNVKQSTGERDHQAVYYIAESGVNVKVAEVKTIIESVYDSTSNANDFFNEIESQFKLNVEDDLENISFQESFNNPPRVSVSINKYPNQIGDQRKYVITSNGTIGNRNRTLSSEFTVEWLPKASGPLTNIPGEMAIFGAEKLVVNGEIAGNVYTNSTSDNSVTFGWDGRISNKLYIGPGGNKDSIISKPNEFNHIPSEKIADLQGELKFNDPVFPTFPELSTPSNGGGINSGILKLTPWNNSYQSSYTMTNNISLNELNSEGDTKITIGSGERNLRLKRLIINNGKLEIEGTGTLNIYIEDQFTITGGGQLRQGINNRVNIFYGGTNKLTIGNGTGITASIFSHTADLEFSGGTSIVGHIISLGSEIKITGGSDNTSSLIYAPQSKVIIDGGAQSGSVVSKQFEINNAKVTYEDIPEEEYAPFFPGTGGGSNSLTDLLDTTPIREK